MVFITNNTEWAASSVGELYQARWGIEVFFKQLKQTLQVCDFPGHSREAIRWQLWAALRLYVLMLWQGQAAGWTHSFSRLLAMTRGGKSDQPRRASEIPWDSRWRLANAELLRRPVKVHGMRSDTL